MTMEREHPERTHRETYPEQYEHSIVGKRVRFQDSFEGTVERVVATRYGLIAIMCQPAECFGLRIIDLTVIEDDEPPA